MSNFQTKLREFVFPEELVFDMWGIIDDWKNGLLEPQKEISEKEVAGGDVTKEGAGTSERQEIDTVNVR